jgi:hypothetical protein
MAPTGFEPATPGLKVQCSTKLSYGALIKLRNTDLKNFTIRRAQCETNAELEQNALSNPKEIN